MNTLISLLDYGQSYWLDNLTREIIKSGNLKKRVSQQGLRGVTSNPSIFSKAISESDSYDTQIRKLVNEGKTPQQIYEALTVTDVRDACDVLKPVYDSSKGTDGFISIEVSPYLARDSRGSVEEARRLFKEVNRKNCFIKIPGTKEGLAAIEESIYEGININITLIFSVERYVEVAQAYIRGLQRRMREGKPVDNVISVASFFLSRIDVLVDHLLSYNFISEMKSDRLLFLSSLFGKAGIASARLAYQLFKEIFSSNIWKELESKGAVLQRPLWASTSTKNPLYDDLLYVESLIGIGTVNTLTGETIEALADHGKLRKNSIEEDLSEASELFGKLKQFNIDIDFVTQQIENEGIEKFIKAYNKLLTILADKRTIILGKKASAQIINFGNLKGEMNSVYAALDEKHVVSRMFDRDPYLWKSEPDQIKSISNRLGWLELPEKFMSMAEELSVFSKQIKQEGFKYAVLLGMGGSSLCSVVTRETFHSSKGYLKLLVLDNTDPAAIKEIEKQIDIKKTLFIVASKSGSTKESIYFYRYFFDLLDKMKPGNPGNNFVAVTDDGTPLTQIVKEQKFRKVFINPGDIGGRYSALSYFGLLPMSLIGIDVKEFLKRAKLVENSCNSFLTSEANPGAELGGLLGIAERDGRNKVTFILSKSVSAFGYWVEQLIAESTGKENKGLIPVNGEELGKPDVYGNDRIFVNIYLDSIDKKDNEVNNKKLIALEKAGNPVIRIRLEDKMAISGEYYRWEIATAIAGAVIGINPFNEPNVAESKKNTDQLLIELERNGSFIEPDPVLKSGNITIYAGKKTETFLGKKYKSTEELIKSFIALTQPGDYIALLPYFLKTDTRHKILQSWRQKLRDNLKVATTLLTGPRYLHSTGQLHKGGPPTGLYILFTADESELAIPGEKFGFAAMNRAQALGDFRSLDSRDRRVIRVHLGRYIDSGLKDITRSVKQYRRNELTKMKDI